MRGKPNCYGLFCKRIMNFAKMGILLDSTFKRLNSQDKLKALQRTSEYDGWKKMAVFLQMGYFYPSFQVLLFLVFRTSYDFFFEISRVIVHFWCTNWWCFFWGKKTHHGHKWIIYSQSYGRICGYFFHGTCSKYASDILKANRVRLVCQMSMTKFFQNRNEGVWQYRFCLNPF